jgi:NAD(P)H-dependent FMN reductase
LKHLRELLEMIGVKVLPGQLPIPSAFQAFDRQGRLARSEDRAALEGLMLDLAKAFDAGKEAAA